MSESMGEAPSQWTFSRVFRYASPLLGVHFVSALFSTYYLKFGTDVLLVSIAWVGAYWLRTALSDVIGNPPNAFESYRVALPAIVIPWIFTCWWFDIYRNARMSTLIDHIQNLIKGVFLGVLVIHGGWRS